MAIVYIRQSSLQQVFQHVESRARQYELVDTAVALGWPAARILVIDEDQGLSGQTLAGRSGFQRVLDEVRLGHVGLVLGLEMSRLARSSLDFQYLLRLCDQQGTLLGDQEGVYDPQDANDRLLLGLKGSMSEFELLTMRQRLQRGKQHKAARAALFHSAPLGYVKVGKDQLALDPDEQVRAVVRLIFAKFAELGSVGAVWRYLRAHDVRLGVRPCTGPRRGQLEWHPASRSTLSRMLRHPVYAGAYVYGRTAGAPATAGTAPSGRERRRQVGRDGWQVLQRERVPAYLTWEEYERNQARLRQNRSVAGAAGAARAGAGLLSGLVVCGACGHRLAVAYPERGRPYYRCRWRRQQGQPGSCGPGLSAAPLDALVTAQVLRVVEPAALDLHLQALQTLDAERARVDEHWQSRLERARYEAGRAERQYQAVEPENRLVARTLEQQWEAALRQLRQLEEEYERARQRQPARLTADERRRIAALAQDIPALWQADSTTPAERKEIVRCLLESVAVGTTAGSEEVAVVLHWQGGACSTHRLARPVRCLEQLQGGARLLERVQALRAQAKTAAAIAAALNAEGYVPPQRRGPYTADGVRQLLLRLGLSSGKKSAHVLGAHEWWLADLAAELQVPEATLRCWWRRGWLTGRQTPVQHLWVLWADRAELRRLRRLRGYRYQSAQNIPQELKTPKRRS